MNQPSDQQLSRTSHSFNRPGNEAAGPATPASSVVLVTGAAGGLGRAICRVLIAEGLSVRALVRPEDDVSLVPLHRSAIKVGYVQNADDVAAAATGVDTIINCAALLPNALHLGAKALFDVNVGGAVTAFETAVAQNVRTAVFFSTISVVDHNNRTVHRDELLDFVPDPGDAYLASKIESERALLRMRSAYGGHLAIVRPAFIYGPGNYAVWKDALRLVTQGKMVLIGNGQAALPLIYAEGLAHYVLALIRGPRFSPPYDIHVVANRETTRIRDVFEFIADYLGCNYPRRVPYLIARLGAMVASCIPKSLRVGPLKLLTPARVMQYSRGYDLSRVLDHPLLDEISMTSYQLGLSRMLDDYMQQK